MAWMLGGCSTYRFAAPGQTESTQGQATVWSYAWGVIEGQADIDCNEQALVEVKLESNFAYDLLSVITLGLVSPKSVEWKCAKADPSEGDPMASIQTRPAEPESTAIESDGGSF